MKRVITDQLAEAAYEARCTALTTGAYPNRAFNIPSQNQYAHWDEIEQLDYSIVDTVRDIYREEAQAAVECFLAFVSINGTPEAKKAMQTILDEMREMLYTDKELAKMEGGISNE